MNKEKQIEEMANILWHIPSGYSLNSYNDCEMIAESIYENGGYRKASEVAEEIFEEIENVINDELQNNYKVLPQFEFSNDLWNKMSGRIEALKEMCDFIAELKKKYTEVGK